MAHGVRSGVLQKGLAGKFAGAGRRVKELSGTEKGEIVRRLFQGGQIRGDLTPIIAAFLEAGRLQQARRGF